MLVVCWAKRSSDGARFENHANLSFKLDFSRDFRFILKLSRCGLLIPVFSIFVLKISKGRAIYNFELYDTENVIPKMLKINVLSKHILTKSAKIYKK